MAVVEKRTSVTEEEKRELVAQGVIIVETSDPNEEIVATDRPNRRVVLVVTK